jgi:hypothetical protein
VSDLRFWEGEGWRGREGWRLESDLRLGMILFILFF